MVPRNAGLGMELSHELWFPHPLDWTLSSSARPIGAKTMGKRRIITITTTVWLIIGECML